MRNPHLSNIKKSDLFEGVDSKEFNQIIDSLDSQLKFYRSGQTILNVGQSINRIPLILEGIVSIYQSDFWGHEECIEVLHDGNIFAEAFACDKKNIANISAVADKPTVILWFNIKDILKIDASDASRTTLIRNIMNTLATKNLNLNNKVTHISKQKTRDKILSYLSSESLKAESNEFDIPYDRQQLADYLGIERSAMSAQISKLAKEGYFDTKKNHFKLKKK